MGEVLGNILPLAVGVAVSPVPVIAVILMLFSAKAKTNSLAFLAGWMLGISVVGLVVLVLGESVSSNDSGESTTAGVVKLILGLLFLYLAVRYWRSRPKEGETPEMPGWMAAIDDFGAAKSGGIAFLLSAVNPKNLALTLAAATTIAASDLGTGEQVVALVVFILIASLTVAVPVLTYLIMGERADEGLTAMKDWLVANNNTVMAVLLLVFAAKLIGDGIAILST